MDDVYDNYYDQALSLQDHFHDSLDDANHPGAIVLQHEIHSLTDDFKQRRHPRSIEDRVKTIEHQLLQVRSQAGSVMSYQDVDHMQHQFQELRERIREMPDY